MNTPPPFKDMSEVASMFAQPFQSREQIEYTIGVCWPGGAAAHFDALLAAGCIELCPSGKGQYRVHEDGRELRLWEEPKKERERQQKLAQLVASVPAAVVEQAEAAVMVALPAEQDEQLAPAESAQEEAPVFSYFVGPIGNTIPYAVVRPAQVHEVIIGGRLKGKTEAIRTTDDGEARHELKKKLDYITPAGVFTKRDNKCLTTRSGLMVLDFDHVPDLDSARTALLNDSMLAPAVVMLFVSPSGVGLKCLLAIDQDQDHLTNFQVVAAYLSHHYAAVGLVPDKSGKDPARACYLCHDPTAYLNPAFAA